LPTSRPVTTDDLDLFPYPNRFQNPMCHTDP
jgi:hypothetical protein